MMWIKLLLTELKQGNFTAILLVCIGLYLAWITVLEPIYDKMMRENTATTFKMKELQNTVEALESKLINMEATQQKKSSTFEIENSPGGELNVGF